MITLYWAAKGGSGTTVVAAATTLAATGPTVLIDLDGDLPLVFGISEPDGPGVLDWLRSSAPGERLASLEIDLGSGRRLIPRGAAGPVDPARWAELAGVLRRERRDVVVDAGTGPPPPALRHVADRSWLVTRACYLSLRAAAAQPCRPDGVVLVSEPGRALKPDDVECSLGAPIVAITLLDPAVARAVDSGLLAASLPRALRSRLRSAS